MDVATVVSVKITYDPRKNTLNIANRGLSFELARVFEWDFALIVEDRRRDYGERRYQALGFIHGRLHMLVFTPHASAIHVISLRKANKREIERHAEKTQP